MKFNFCPQCGKEHPDHYESALCCDVQPEGETEEQQFERLFGDELREHAANAAKEIMELPDADAGTVDELLARAAANADKVLDAPFVLPPPPDVEACMKKFPVGAILHMRLNKDHYYDNKRLIIRSHSKGGPNCHDLDEQRSNRLARPIGYAFFWAAFEKWVESGELYVTGENEYGIDQSELEQR